MRYSRLSVLAAMLLLAGCQPATDTASSVENAMDNATDAAAPPGNAAGAPLVYCPPVRTELPQAECDLVTRQIADLTQGMGKLVAPTQMQRGTTATVRFSVAPGAAAPTVAPAPSPDTGAPAPGRAPARADDPGTTTREIEVRIGGHMTALLEGSGFDISPPGEQARDLGASSRAVWTWTVKPIQGGDQPLYLTVTTKALDRNGRPTQLDLFSDSARIIVSVSVWDRLSDLLGRFTSLFGTTEGTLKALAALLVAAGAVVLAWRKIFARPKPEGEASP